MAIKITGDRTQKKKINVNLKDEKEEQKKKNGYGKQKSNTINLRTGTNKLDTRPHTENKYFK